MGNNRVFFLSVKDLLEFFEYLNLYPQILSLRECFWLFLESIDNQIDLN